MESNSNDPKTYPSFFDEQDGLPVVDEHISTGFPSLNTESISSEETQKSLDTGSIPSFYSAFDLDE